jgi:hypothetical protein
MTTLDLNNTPQEQLNKEMDRYREIIIKLMDDDLRSGERYEEIK